MEYQRKIKIVLREDLVYWFVRPINCSAAMVFEEAAHLSYQLGH